MTVQYDSMPISVIGPVGGQISLQDILTQAYGDQVGSIASVQIAYRDSDQRYARERRCSLWSVGPG